jgi:hypothetical protein
MAKLTEEKALEQGLLRLIEAIKDGPLAPGFVVPHTYSGEPSLDVAIRDALDWLREHRVDRPLAPLHAFCFGQHRKGPGSRCFPPDDRWAFEIAALRIIQIHNAAYWRRVYIEDTSNVQGTPMFLVSAGYRGKKREDKIRYCETILKNAGLM